MSSRSVFMDDVLKHPPPGLNYVVNVQRSMIMALLAGMFASFLASMLIALFAFASQHACRKTPIFWLNVAALLVGILQGIYLIIIEVRSALHPPLSDTFVFVWYILSFYTPIFVDSILIIRLAAVYSPETTPPHLRRFVVGFPIFWKFVRFALATVLLTFWITDILQQGIPVDAGLLGWSGFPYTKIGWGLQLLDNTFCSVAFLTRLGFRIRMSTKFMNGGDRKHRRNVTERLKIVFAIALSNYVIPTVISATHLIISIIHDRYSDPTWMYLCAYLMILSNYTTIMGVVFATVWAASREWALSHCICSGDLYWDPTSRVSTMLSKYSRTPSLTSPKSAHFLSESCPSSLQTPISPEFLAVHYNQNFQPFPADLSGAARAAKDISRIYPERPATSTYNMEDGTVVEESKESLPELDDPIFAVS